MSELTDLAIMDPNAFSKILAETQNLVLKKSWNELERVDALLDGLLITNLLALNRDWLLDCFSQLCEFLDSEGFEAMLANDEGSQYAHRLSHLCDLVETAVKGYSPEMASQFLRSHKDAQLLMTLLFEGHELHLHGLAARLDMVQEQVPPLLDALIEQLLIERAPERNLIRLSLIGRAFMILQKRNENSSNSINADRSLSLSKANGSVWGDLHAKVDRLLNDWVANNKSSLDSLDLKNLRQGIINFIEDSLHCSDKAINAKHDQKVRRGQSRLQSQVKWNPVPNPSYQYFNYQLPCTYKNPPLPDSRKN